MPKVISNKKFANNNAGRDWCFTWHVSQHAHADAEQQLLSLVDLPNFQYGVFGRELTKSQGPHLQGYLEFEPPIRPNRLLSYLDPTVHLERRAHSRQSASQYCKKEDDYIEFGHWRKPKGQGKRTDLSRVQDLITNGGTEREVAVAHFGNWCRYRRSFSRYRQIVSRETPLVRDWVTEVHVRWGPANSGKTRWFRDRYPNALMMSKENGFWSSYGGQAVVLWDEFENGSCSRSELLRLTDRYPCQIRQLGAYAEWTPRVICITSNFPPEAWIEQSQAIIRRCTTIVECRAGQPYVVPAKAVVVRDP